MLDIEYNGVKGSELKVYAKDRPEIPAAKRVYEEIVLPGKDGIYLIDTGRYENVNLNLRMNYIGNENEWYDKWRKIKSWLSKTNGELTLSDDPDYYFKVSKVIIGNNIRLSKRIGDFDVTFVLKDGLHYLKKGKEKHDPKEAEWNPGEESFPLFCINGTGNCVISINDQEFKVVVNGKIIIDSERQVIYSEDKKIINNIAKGNYKNLCLLKGKNVINVTKGFDVKIIPNWRCL